MIDHAELRRREYIGRINRVMDYIRKNISGDLRLETLASVANFSPFHFHRLFSAMVGETLNGYIRRLRAQKAASHLIYHPRMSITQIATACGYSSPSAFAREFRRTFGMSASQFRAGGVDSICIMRDALRGGDDASERTQVADGGRKTWSPMVFSVEAKRLPELHVAYVRHTGRYNQIGGAFERLMRWAGPRGLLQFPHTQVLAIYYENPDVTPEAKLRSDACITVRPGIRIEGDVGIMNVPGGLFAVAHAEIDEAQYAEAWDRLLGEWMPESGYVPDDRLCYELYLNDPAKHPENKHIIDICEPVRPL